MSERTYLDGYFDGRRDAEEAVTPAAGSEPGGEARRTTRMGPCGTCGHETVLIHEKPWEKETPHHATPPSSVAERAALYDHGRGPLIAGTDVASVAQFDEHAHERPSSVAERGGLDEQFLAIDRALLATFQWSDREHVKHGLAAHAFLRFLEQDGYTVATPVAATLDVERLARAMGEHAERTGESYRCNPGCATAIAAEYDRLASERGA